MSSSRSVKRGVLNERSIEGRSYWQGSVTCNGRKMALNCEGYSHLSGLMDEALTFRIGDCGFKSRRDRCIHYNCLFAGK